MTRAAMHLKWDAMAITFESQRAGERLTITRAGESAEIEILAFGDGEAVVRSGGRTHRLHVARDGDVLWVSEAGRTWVFRKVAPEAVAAAAHAGDTAEITSPMAGRIVKLACAPGDAVSEGQILVVLEAMKMEYQLRSPFAGTVETLNGAEGAQVGHGEVLVALKRTGGSST
jgi:acetyl/propionyl-CoA carboxylase alpha subunit